MAIENAKTLNVRIRNKYDSYENWIASGLVLEAGEIAICHTTVDVKVDNGTAKHPALLMKVGDGEKTFANLPWLSAKAADVLAVCKNEDELKTFINGVIADAGIATNDAMEALAGRVTAVENDLNTEGTGLKARVTTAEGAIAALDELVGDESVATQIKNYVDGLNLATTYAALEHTHTKDEITDFDHNHEISEVNGLQDALDGLQVKGDYASKDHDHAVGEFDTLAEAIDDAKKAGTDAQDAVDALAGKVGEVPADKTVVGMIAEAQEAATYDDTALAGRVSDLEELTGGVKVSDAIDSALKVEKDGVNVDKYALAEHTHEIADVTGLSDAIADAKQAGTDANAALETYKGTNDAAVKKVADDLAAEAQTARAAEKANADDIDALEEKIGTVTEGKTIVDMIADAKTEATYDDTELANRVGELETLVGDDPVSTQIANAFKNEDGSAKYALASELAAEAEAARAAEQANANAITKLNAGAETEGSVDYKVAQAVAAIMENPDETMNSINELVTWVNDHAEDALELSNQVSANKTALETLNGNAETDGSVAKQVAAGVTEAKGYTDAEVKKLAEGAVADNAAAIADLEELVGDTAVATQITNALTVEQEGGAKVEKYALATALAATDAEVAKKANDADLAAIAKTGSTDDLVQGSMILVFDCGNSSEA